MRAHPGQITQLIEIPFAYPRRPALRGEARFAQLTAHISRQLRGNAA
jgi:hypothetical protein